MTKQQEILKKHYELKSGKPCDEITLHHLSYVCDAMDEFSEIQTHIVYKLFATPYEQLKPLQDLWRKENPHKNGYYVIPDLTKFLKWIVKRFNKEKKAKEKLLHDINTY